MGNIRNIAITGVDIPEKYRDVVFILEGKKDILIQASSIELKAKDQKNNGIKPYTVFDYGDDGDNNYFYWSQGVALRNLSNCEEISYHAFMDKYGNTSVISSLIEKEEQQGITPPTP